MTTDTLTKHIPHPTGAQRFKFVEMGVLQTIGTFRAYQCRV